MTDMAVGMFCLGIVIGTLLAAVVYEWDSYKQKQKTTREILRGLRQPAWKSETREERKP